MQLLPSVPSGRTLSRCAWNLLPTSASMWTASGSLTTPPHTHTDHQFLAMNGINIPLLKKASAHQNPSAASVRPQPITIEEVQDAACGDDTPVEFYNCGGARLYDDIFTALNKIFETSQPMNAVYYGILIPLKTPATPCM